MKVIAFIIVWGLRTAFFGLILYMLGHTLVNIWCHPPGRDAILAVLAFAVAVFFIGAVYEWAKKRLKK